MMLGFSRSQIALAVTAALATTAVSTATADNDRGRGNDRGTYVAGDFHNHSTCSDGSTSMQQKVKKSMDRVETPWGLDWFVQAGHGGNGVRNCTLVEDESLATPAYPFVPGQGPQTTWAQSIGAANVKGNAANGGAALSTQANPAMWRWQSIQEFQYPLLEYLAAFRNEPLFIGLESVVAGHEHSSMAVITGQMPDAIHRTPLPAAPPYRPLGNANAFAQWSYCFDRGDADWSRGNTMIGGTGNNWECSVPGSPNSTSPAIGFNTTAQKIIPVAPTGTNGHLKTVEAMKWMKEFHERASYYVPAHLERAGVFNPNGNNGYNIEHLRNFNNAAPKSAFGFESQPGHGASGQRGEYQFRRNGAISGGTPPPGWNPLARVDSVGGTTYGGTGVYAAQVGGVWDALLGEGRNWWFFASSDWHSRRMFGTHDRRSNGDFWPGEYQRNYTMVSNERGRHGHDRDDDDRDGHHGKGKSSRLSPQAIVDGLRTGNTWVDSGQLIDRLAFVACVGRSTEAVEEMAVDAARGNTDVDHRDCATMGAKLEVRRGQDVVVSIVVRDPDGTSFSPYTFNNPSLAQVGVQQPLNKPVLDHIDVIRGMVTGYKMPGAADYSGEWPRNWLVPSLQPDGSVTATKLTLAQVPAAAKNTSAAIIKTFNSDTWETVRRDREFKKMTFRIRDVKQSQYIRLRGTNLPPSVPFETDADGNPLPDMWTNPEDLPARLPATDPDAGKPENVVIPQDAMLRIPCMATGSNVPSNAVEPPHRGTIDGCPNHLPVKNGQKMVAFDVASWADLWFYSNPIFIEVRGSTPVEGVASKKGSTRVARAK